MGVIYVGVVCDLNEDVWIVVGELLVFVVVVDGMGGYEVGEVVLAVVIEILCCCVFEVFVLGMVYMF